MIELVAAVKPSFPLCPRLKLSLPDSHLIAYKCEGFAQQPTDPQLLPH